jgi:hypothetical protein
MIMKANLLILALCLSLLGHAQIPNGSLDNWTTESLLQLDEWNSIGNASLSTDATEGNYSVRLENTLDNGVFGLITNADLQQDLTGGQDYTDIPLTMSFAVKYDLAQGDAAKVLAIFSVQGQPLGLVDYTITGNSGDSFQYINYPIQWATQVKPDTVIVLVSSIDPDNSDFNGDGYLIIDDIKFKNISIEKDSVDNPSFESWSSFEVPHPVDWYTTDRLILDEGGAAVNFESAINPPHRQSGAGAIRLRNFEIDGQLAPGAAVTGNTTLGIDKPTFPVSEKWTYLHGLYKYKPTDGDKALIAATFFANGALIGAAQFRIEDSTSGDDYVYFSAEVQYVAPGTPDSATVILASADLQNPKGDSTKLWVDNLSFTNHTAGLKGLETTAVKVYPNPAQTSISISAQGSLDKIEVYNQWGQVIYSGQEGRLDISDWASGAYSIKIHTDDKVLNRKFIKL